MAISIGDAFYWQLSPEDREMRSSLRSQQFLMDGFDDGRDVCALSSCMFFIATADGMSLLLAILLDLRFCCFSFGGWGHAE